MTAKQEKKIKELAKEAMRIRKLADKLVTKAEKISDEAGDYIAGILDEAGY